MKRLLLLAVLSLAALAAHAQPYVAAALTHQEVKAAGITDSRTLLGVGAGYRFGLVAGEAMCAGNADCNVGGVLAIPVAGGFHAVGKVAAHYLRGDVTESQASGSVPFGPTVQVKHEWSGWAAGAGVGFEYRPTQSRLAARVLLEQTGSVGVLKRSRLLSIGATYSF